MRVALVVASLCVPLLAGCAGQADTEEAEFERLVENTTVEVETTRELGAVKGIVVDAAINPIAGARIRLADREAISDKGGGFGLSGIEPGSHFIDVRKDGYEPSRLVVDVAAGKEPKWTRVVLTPLPSDLPAYDLFHYVGMIGSSVIVSAAGIPIGYTAWDPVTGANMNHNWDIESPVEFVQMEFVWDANLPLFGDLWPLFLAGTGSTSAGIAGESGPSPIILPVSNETIRERLNGAAPTSVGFVIFAGWEQPASVAIAFQQEYEVFTHVFHNFRPPTDWAFVHDGAPTGG